MRLLLGLGVLLFSFGLSSCKPTNQQSGGTPDKSNDIITRKSEQRPITGFNQITVRSGIEVHMMSQAQCTFAVSAPVDIIPLVKTKVDYGNLIIWVDADRLTLNRPVQVYLSSVDLIGVNLSDAATADISTVKEKILKVSLTGASTLKVKGKAKILEALLDNASKLDAGEFVAQEVKLGSKSASKALVNAVNKLDVEADGASIITYKGSPKVKAVANGASTVSVAKSKKAD